MKLYFEKHSEKLKRIVLFVCLLSFSVWRSDPAASHGGSGGDPCGPRQHSQEFLWRVQLRQGASSAPGGPEQVRTTATHIFCELSAILADVCGLTRSGQTLSSDPIGSDVYTSVINEVQPKEPLGGDRKGTRTSTRFCFSSFCWTRELKRLLVDASERPRLTRLMSSGSGSVGPQVWERPAAQW